jgi:hypothetical protein
MKTNEFINDLGTSEYASWILVQQAHLENCYNESIEECGYNNKSNYVCIALQNGIQIVSCLGEPVKYIKYDFKTGEEYFFDTYEEALNN